jgi:outer membrane translocation and assembly module TamA
VPLLRAHPLLEDGIVQLGADSVFGRTVSYANVEAQRWLASSSLVRIGIAGFTDVGTAVHGTTLVQVDVGIGARLRIPKAVGTLRIDAARGLDGAHAVTVGWQF